MTATSWRMTIGLLLPAAAIAVAPGCVVGSGEGEIAGFAYLPACGYAGGADPDVDGSPFSLPIDSFFGEVVGERIVIRLQVGGANIGTSDGLVIEVADRHALAAAIAGNEGRPVEVEVPPQIPPNTAAGARASLYLNWSCPDAFVDFSRGSGTVFFDSIYAREADGDHADIDGIAGRFEGLEFRDERPGAAVPPWATVDGWFRFSYTRGRPSQPFP
ncbi:MAG: hypothetical protein QME96_16075 [Myxococcota bacterium]|nr:hypothetical protein [Myxococcota bacterium]